MLFIKVSYAWITVCTLVGHYKHVVILMYTWRWRVSHQRSLRTRSVDRHVLDHTNDLLHLMYTLLKKTSFWKTLSLSLSCTRAHFWTRNQRDPRIPGNILNVHWIPSNWICSRNVLTIYSIPWRKELKKRNKITKSLSYVTSVFKCLCLFIYLFLVIKGRENKKLMIAPEDKKTT